MTSGGEGFNGQAAVEAATTGDAAAAQQQKQQQQKQAQRRRERGGPYSAHERAERALRARIAEGVYPPGGLLPTERQIVEEVGVSRPMVRAALQRLAEDGWITREPGHRPRVAARPPRQSSSEGRGGFAAGSAPGTGRLPGHGGAPGLRAVAAVMPMDLGNPAAFSIQYGIQRTLQRHESPYRLVVIDSLSGVRDADGDAEQDALNAEAERRALESVAREGIAGVILWQTGGEATLPALSVLRAAGVPVVFVDRFPDAPGAPPVDFVGVDNRSGAREAVTHLLRRGHRRIAHLTFPARSREGASVPVRERYEGYREALWEAGVVPDPSLVGNSLVLRDRILAGGADAPTAVFAVNDASANRFIERLAEVGKRVPEDVSVVGFDDVERLSHRTPRLTTMYLPFESVGERAAELLLRRLRDPLGPGEPTSHLLLSTALVVRSTCADREPPPLAPPIST